MKTEFLYSIIIPHYNSSKLLERMLKSIPERDDIQVIVVDDCSKEEEVCALKELKHKNLELYLQNQNHGAGYVRNVGLEHVRGKWILFADADDFYVSNTFDILDNYRSDEIDYLNFCVKSVDSLTGNPGKRKITSDNSVRKYLQVKSERNLMLFKYRNFVLWNKMISSDFVKNYKIKCENCKVNNDVFFSFQLAFYSHSFKVIPDELYCCTYSSGSLTFRKRNVEREYLFYKQAKKRNGFYKKIGLGYPFLRYDFVYLPYFIYKRGFQSACDFYKYCWTHRDELKNAEKAYLNIFDTNES